MKPLPRIGFVVESPLSANDADRFGIVLLLSRGHDVVVWDVSNISRPHIRHIRQDLTLITPHIARSADDLRVMTRDLAQCELLLVHFGNGGTNPANLPILRALAKTGRPRVNFFNNAYPGWNRYRGETGKKWRRICDIGHQLLSGKINFLSALLSRLPPSLLGIRPPDYAVYGGTAGPLADPISTGMTQPIWAHSNDFERSRPLLDNPPPMQRQAVFIDEFLPYHPDLEDIGHPPAMTPEVYYPRLRHAFDQIERQFDLKVVIAACPRADYSNKGALFGDRQVVHGATMNLVAESLLVLGHRSTALSYGVIFGKPIFLLVTQELLEDPVHVVAINSFGQNLGVPKIHFDALQSIALPQTLEHDSHKYAAFLEQFTKRSGTANKALIDIILDATQSRWDKNSCESSQP